MVCNVRLSREKNDIEAFASGATIPIRITADASTPGNGEGKIKLNGVGTVIRSKIIM